MKYHVFVDFDGTIARRDVGHDFFDRFTSHRITDVVEKYHKGEIGAKECLAEECEIYNEAPASDSEVADFINAQELTPGFTEFVAFCDQQDIKLTVLSAGFDFYIKPILERHDLADLELICTPAVIEQGRIYPDFIYYDENVCRYCANCKGQRIRELLADGEIPVFIGDGHSDNHGAQAAAVIFAKSFLARYLEEQKLEYFYYNDFFDVLKRFKKIIDENGNSRI